jgi:hypothetical protein
MCSSRDFSSLGYGPRNVRLAGPLINSPDLLGNDDQLQHQLLAELA